MTINSPSTFSFLSGGGETGELLRAKDWTQTPVGDPATWPPALRNSLSIIFNSGYPMFVWWGKEMIMFHNDAYIPVLGNKHPAALGESAPLMWAEIWKDIGGIAAEVFDGIQFYAKDLPLFLDRKGFIEETYWTFSHSPILNEDGTVGGLFCACNEETDKVLRQRRLQSLKEILDIPTRSTTVLEVAVKSAAALSRNAADVPFCALYLFSEDGTTAQLAYLNGFDHPQEQFPETFRLKTNGAFQDWHLDEIYRNGEATNLQELKEKIPEFSALGNVVSERTTVLPLKITAEKASGILICGISNTLEFNEEYSIYLTLAAKQISGSISSALVFEADQKRAKMLAELDAAKTAFFSNISHEFRTPLTLMVSPLEEMMQAMNTRFSSQEELENLGLLHRNTRRLHKLVNNLLDFSRIGAGRMQGNFELTDLCELTADLTSSFRSTIEHAGMTLDIECQPLPEPVYVDRNMWEKIVLNLLSNAFKYTLEGTISVRLQAQADHAELAISDTGTGISEADLPHIFERFYRAQNTGGRTYEGTGIGLSLVMELVKLHGGRIDVESKVGQGTTITIRLPYGQAHLPAEQVRQAGAPTGRPAASSSVFDEISSWNGVGAPAEEQVPSSPQPKKYVLLADDNADMRLFISRLLSPQFEVKTVANGSEALEQIQRRIPDLLLCDIIMLGMDGITLLGLLRSERKTRDIPVILLSARAGEEAIEEGLQKGADDYLVKPFSARELKSRVSAILQLRDLRAQSDSQFKNMVMQAPFILGLLKGDDLVVEAANEMILKVWGKTADIIGKPILEAIPEMVGQPFPALLWQVYRSGEAFYGNEYSAFIEHEGVLKSFHFNFVYQPFRELDGTISGIIVVAADVTEQVKARRRVEASEQKFRNLLAQSPMAICILKTSDFLIESANDVIMDVWGKGKDVLDKPLLEVLPEMERQGIAELLRKVYETGTPFHANEMKIEFVRYGVLEAKYFNFVYQPYRELDGEISGITVIATEVTQQAIAHQQLAISEAALRESEGRLKMALDIADIGTWEYHFDTHVFSLSPRTIEYIGFTPEDVLTLENAIMGIAEEDRQRSREAFEKAMEPGSDGVLDIELTTFGLQDKRRRLLRSKGQISFNADGTPHHFVGVTFDITKQREVRNLLEQEIEQRTKALAQTNQTFEHAEQVGKFGSYAYQYETGVLSYSDNLYRLIGYEPGDFEPGRQFYDHVYPEDVADVERWQEEAFGKKIINKWEYRLIRKDGEVIWVRGSGREQVDETGAAWLIGTLQDITEEKKREQKITETNKLLLQTNQTFEYAEQVGKFGSYAYEYASGKITYSDNMYRLLGCEPGEFVPGDAFYEFVHPDDRDYIVTNARVEAFEDHKTGPWEYRMVRKDGDVIWARSSGQIVISDGGGEWLIGTVQNITESKNREMELQRQKEFVETLIDASVDNIIVFDKETNLVLLNQKAAVTMGLPPESLLGKKLPEVFPVSTKPHQEILNALSGVQVHVPLHHSNLSGRIYDYHFIPLREKGEIVGALCISHDNTEFVTALERVKEVEDKNLELEQFAYLASHDLQEPLNTIASFVEIVLSEEKFSPSGLEYMGIIKESSTRLKDTINDLLAYSKIGKQSQVEVTDLNSLVESVLTDMQATISSSNARIEAGNMPTLQVHPNEMRLLFQNLLSNALKFQRPGVVPQVKISAEKTGTDWHFIVSDNGIGIEEKYKERIFLIFQRLHTFQEYEGTGIGLAHCQKIVALHGGRLWLESEVGNGSDFHFTIPENLGH